MTTEEWIPADAPPDEEYWEALMRDGEQGPAAPAEAQLLPWNLENTDGSNSRHQDPWETARLVMERGEIIQSSVVGWNRGGVLIGWNGLRGFVPASHLKSISMTSKTDLGVELRSLVGRQLNLRIIELDPQQSRFVLSEQPSQPDGCKKLIDTLCPGEVCQGRVTSFCSFGAFVELGGVEGLVHISELAWGRVRHPSEVLELGQLVDVYVLDVDRERGRVRLSIKRLQPDPWVTAAARYRPGQLVNGVVTRVTDFGAFVQIEPGLEGLLHVSELGESGRLHPRYVVEEGDQITARILSIDEERRRIALSMRTV